jgi:hypothetical protein
MPSLRRFFPRADIGPQRAGDRRQANANIRGRMKRNLIGPAGSLYAVLAAAACFIVAGSAHAVPLKDYLGMKNSETFRQYLMGVAAGFQQANAELQLRRMRKLYCEPPNATLQFDSYTAIVEKEVQENAAFYTVESSVESALLFGLMKAQPCK